MTKVLVTSTLLGLDQKNDFFERWSWFKFNNLELAPSYGLEILHPCGKRVKTKSEKVLGANSYISISYRGKQVGGDFLAPSHPK